MVTAIVTCFILGYLCIALESVLKINKAVPALLMCVVCWTLYACGYAPEVGADTSAKLLHHLGDTCEILFFLMGAMTIVEIVDANGGFFFVKDALATTSKRKLLWRITFMAFILSAILDNLTTSIVMIMVLRKLVDDHDDRMIYGGMIVIAANAGGAFSPIGDVTTIMLWVKGNVTAGALVAYVTLPSIVACVVPALWVRRSLRGQLGTVHVTETQDHKEFTHREKLTMLILGVTGLVMVPVFKTATHMPPFVGMLLVLGILWIYTEIFYNRRPHYKGARQHRLQMVIKRIDFPSILFFLGILMAVDVLDASGILAATAAWLDKAIHNIYIINVVLGMMSSVFDNVPLVAGVMGMYPVTDASSVGYAAQFVQDGVFWEFLSYCAGVGGSMLIIGSAAGVIAMGLEKISFGWYLKKFSIPALLGYLCGAGVYILEVILFK